MTFSWRLVWRLVKQWWWLLVVGAVLAGGTGYYFASKKPNIYAARTTLMVGANIRNPDPNSRDFGLTVTLAQIYGEMAKRRPITQAVVDRLGLPMEWWDLAGRIETRVNPTAQLLEITVFDTDPQVAALLANAVAEELVRQSPASQEGVERDFVLKELNDTQAKIEEAQAQIDQLRDKMLGMTSAVELSEAQARLAELEQLKSNYRADYVRLANLLNTQSPNTLTIMEPASPSRRPIAPNPKKSAAIAAVAGLILAVGAVILLEFFDDTIYWYGEQESIVGARLLGTIGRFPAKSDKVIVRRAPRSPAAEMVRQLRSKILLAQPGRTFRTLLVTSAAPQDGKTVAVANLGAAMASAGMRTVVVDADFRAPSLHESFDLPNVLGLAELLSAGRDEYQALLDKALLETNVERLTLLPAGRPPLDPTMLLTSPRFPELLDLLLERFDAIVMDSPPVLLAPDAVILATRADGTVMVVSAEHTSRQAARRAIKVLRDQEGVNFLGVVVNRIPLHHYAYYLPPQVTSEAAAVSLPRRVWRRLTGFLKPIRQRLGLGRERIHEDGRVLLSLAEAAHLLGVRKETARRWCASGRLPAVKRGLRWWVEEEALQAMLNVQLGWDPDGWRQVVGEQARGVTGHRGAEAPGQPGDAAPAMEPVAVDSNLVREEDADGPA